MVTEVAMTVWIRLVQGSEKVKELDVNKAHGKSANNFPQKTRFTRVEKVMRQETHQT